MSGPWDPWDLVDPDYSGPPGKPCLPIPYPEPAEVGPAPEQWLASTDDAPLFAMLPDGVQEQRLAEAIALCQRAGLLPDTPHGVVYLPEGTEMS